jgi:hypothetical protein
MTWGCGLFRLWVVLSVVWVLLVGVVIDLEWLERRTLRPDTLSFDAYDLAEVAIFAIVPPAGVLALGAALFWAARGFKKES